LIEKVYTEAFFGQLSIITDYISFKCHWLPILLWRILY